MREIMNTIALISLVVIAITLFISIKTKANLGIISILAAFIFGFFVYINVGTVDAPKMAAVSSIAGKATAFINGWNASIFITVFGTTALFTAARVNGTSAVLARKMVAAAKGQIKLLPFAFFFIATVISALGPGNLATVALLFPMAYAVAREEDVDPLLMVLMVNFGANCGAYCPVSMVGAMVIGMMDGQGYAGASMILPGMITTIIYNLLFATGCYFIMGGHKVVKHSADAEEKQENKFDRNQIITIVVCILVLVTLAILKISNSTLIGIYCTVGCAVLLIVGAADSKKLIDTIPWNALIVISGFGVLINVVNTAGGITLLTNALAAISNTTIGSAILMVSSGLLSFVSSAVAVVLPTMTSTIPGLVEQLALNPQTALSAVMCGAFATNISPLSTLGAISMGNASKEESDHMFASQFIIAFANLAFGFVFFLIMGILHI